MLSWNALRNLDRETIEQIKEELYKPLGDEDIFTQYVECVDAVHIDEDGEQSRPYTWFMPTSLEIEIEVGDTLVVEQTVGIGLAFVKAIGEPYLMAKEQHEEMIHPYCPVIANLGERL